MMFFPLPIAYAEIHYRFRFFFNLLKKHEPEIIADVPSRLLKNEPMPVLLLVKDAHLYPITLLKIEVFIGTQKAFRQELETKIDSHFYERIFEIPVHSFPEGNQPILVKIVYRIKNKVRTCFNDNYRQTSHAPLNCYFSPTPLPAAKGWGYGDLHSHSSYTEDQIEFGAGIPVMRRIARAIGLDFFAVTDHSYDLDDFPDNYLQNDPALTKWKAFQQECHALNSKADGPIIVPGEELSVGNHKRQNVHLLIWNNPDFIKGTGDGGEKWFRFKPDYNLQQIPSLISKQAMVVPAHPAESVSLAQKIFINRGNWHEKDLRHPFLNGLQFINGGNWQEIEQGIQLWTRLLLEGRRLAPLAGNDAHGHFARTREINIPFLLLQERMKHLFGRWRTGLFFAHAPRSPQDVLAAIKTGRVFVTNGPFLNMQVLNNGQTFHLGQEVPAVDQIVLQAISTPEFGSITRLALFWGDLEQKKENLVWEKSFDQTQEFNRTKKISLPLSGKNGYIRSQVITTTRKNHYMALTNAIWIRKV